MATPGPPCTVCSHEQIDDINKALLAKEAYAKIAVRFRVGRDSLRRHSANHMGELLAEERKTKQPGDANSALARLEDLYDRTNKLLAQAEHNSHTTNALQAVRELRTTLESIAKITGELNDKPSVTINLAASPEWMQLQTLILAALNPFPEARIAVLDAIDLVGEIEP